MSAVVEAPARAHPQTVVAQLASGANIVGVMAAALFHAFPSIDIEITRAFYLGEGRFLGCRFGVFEIVRFILAGSVAVSAVVVAAGLIVSRPGRTAFLGVGFDKWLFIALCLATGPVLVANLGLKDHWGRARPRDIAEFGGPKQFTPPLLPSSQCGKNCSFVSGETSGVFVILFGAAVTLPAFGQALLLSGLLLGALTGLIRIAQGGHFLSDVIFSGVLMALTVAGIKSLFAVIEQGGERGGATTSRGLPIDLAGGPVGCG